MTISGSVEVPLGHLFRLIPRHVASAYPQFKNIHIYTHTRTVCLVQASGPAAVFSLVSQVLLGALPGGSCPGLPDLSRLVLLHGHRRQSLQPKGFSSALWERPPLQGPSSCSGEALGTFPVASGFRESSQPLLLRLFTWVESGLNSEGWRAAQESHRPPTGRRIRS